MTGLECACIAKVVGDKIDLRTSANGTDWAGFTAVVGNGPDESTWLRVSVFGEVARALAGAIDPNTRLYIEGRARINEYEGKGGQHRVGLALTAWKAERVAIGRSRRPKEKPAQEARAKGPDDRGSAARNRHWQRPLSDANPF